MDFLEKMESQDLGGCQVPVGPRGRWEQGVRLELLDRKDLQDQQGPAVLLDSQEREVYQGCLGHLGLQAHHRQLLPASQNQTIIEEKTRSSPTLSMTPEVCLFQDLRVHPGLLVLQVPEAQ